jgi:hypothetical protein
MIEFLIALGLVAIPMIVIEIIIRTKYDRWK